MYVIIIDAPLAIQIWITLSTFHNEFSVSSFNRMMPVFLYSKPLNFFWWPGVNHAWQSINRTKESRKGEESFFFHHSNFIKADPLMQLTRTFNENKLSIYHLFTISYFIIVIHLNVDVTARLDTADCRNCVEWMN